MPLVVDWVVGISQIKDDRRMGTGTATVSGEDGFEINRPVEAQATIREDVNPVTLVVAWGVEDGDL
jgi:hypothetical protein